MVPDSEIQLRTEAAKEVVQYLGHKDVPADIRKAFYRFLLKRAEIFSNTFQFLVKLCSIEVLLEEPLNLKEVYKTPTQQAIFAISDVYKNWKVKEFVYALEQTGNEHIITDHILPHFIGKFLRENKLNPIAGADKEVIVNTAGESEQGLPLDHSGPLERRSAILSTVFNPAVEVHAGGHHIRIVRDLQVGSSSGCYSAQESSIAETSFSNPPLPPAHVQLPSASRRLETNLPASNNEDIAVATGKRPTSLPLPEVNSTQSNSDTINPEVVSLLSPDIQATGKVFDVEAAIAESVTYKLEGCDEIELQEIVNACACLSRNLEVIEFNNPLLKPSSVWSRLWTKILFNPRLNFPKLRRVKLWLRTKCADDYISKSLMKSLLFFCSCCANKLWTLDLEMLSVKIDGMVYVHIEKKPDKCSLVLNSWSEFVPCQFLMDANVTLTNFHCHYLSLSSNALIRCTNLVELNLNNCYIDGDNSVGTQVISAIEKLENLRRLTVDLGRLGSNPPKLLEGSLDLGIITKFPNLSELIVGHCDIAYNYKTTSAADVVKCFEGKKVVFYNCKSSVCELRQYLRLPVDNKVDSRLIIVENGKIRVNRATKFNVLHVTDKDKCQGMNSSEYDRYFHMGKFFDMDSPPAPSRPEDRMTDVNGNHPE